MKICSRCDVKICWFVVNINVYMKDILTMAGTNSLSKLARNKKIYDKILKARKMDAEQIFYQALEQDTSSCELVKCYSMPYRRRRKSNSRRKVRDWLYSS